MHVLVFFSLKNDGSTFWIIRGDEPQADLQMQQICGETTRTYPTFKRWFWRDSSLRVKNPLKSPSTDHWNIFHPPKKGLDRETYELNHFRRAVVKCIDVKGNK